MTLTDDDRQSATHIVPSTHTTSPPRRGIDFGSSRASSSSDLPSKTSSPPSLRTRRRRGSRWPSSSSRFNPNLIPLATPRPVAVINFSTPRPSSSPTGATEPSSPATPPALKRERAEEPALESPAPKRRILAAPSPRPVSSAPADLKNATASAGSALSTVRDTPNPASDDIIADIQVTIASVDRTLAKSQKAQAKCSALTAECKRQRGEIALLQDRMEWMDRRLTNQEKDVRRMIEKSTDLLDRHRP